MVSARLMKRFIAVVFLSSIAVVFLYKNIQTQRSDYIAGSFKQTEDFSRVKGRFLQQNLNSGDLYLLNTKSRKIIPDVASIIHDRDKSKVRPRSEDEREDPTEDDEVIYDMENLTYQDTGINATEPPEKIHRGVEGDDEVEETLDWLQEHGATPPPDPSDFASSPVTDIEESTIADQTSSSTQSSVPSTPSSPKQSLTSELSSTTDAEDTTTVTQDDAATESFATSTLPSSKQSSTSEPSSTTDAEDTTIVTQDDAATQSSSSTLPSSTQRYGAQQNHSRLPFNADISSHFTTPSTTRLPTPIYTTSPNLNTCKLPNLDPWDPSISHLLKDVGDDPRCRGGYPLPAFDVNDNRLILTGEVNASSIDFSEVNVETIHRDNGDDGYVHFANQGNPFNASAEEFQPSNVITKSDFFVLKYKLSSGKEVTNYLARAVPQKDVIDESSRMRQKFGKQGKNEGLGLNVVMLGFDSVSAANFRRKMPKSINFLKRSLKTYFISGQTIVGDGTTPALTAMLTGLYEQETPEGRQGYDNSAPIDKWPWIMNLYKERGYVTMMGEDDPTMGAFNLRLRGFEDPPVHHYTRPFWLALEERYERDEPGLCSRSTFMLNYTLDYVLSYFAAYPNTPKFAFAFMSYLTHAHPNHLSYADNDIVRLLRTFVHRKYHDNTVIILFGDHGSRNDDVRNTMQGKLEERLPWLSISVPAWLEKKYPDITSALEHNQHIISSPFDVHATLRHVLTYPEEPRGEKTQSLFRKLNYTRTCSEAGVGEHWCPCLEFTDVDPTHPEVVIGGQMAVKYINDVILNRTKLLRTSCARVQLKKILKASSYKPNEKLRRFSSTNQDSDRAVNFGLPTSDSLHYRINFMTSPGDALFEATVTMREDYNVIVNPNLSRTNLYGDQPRCILRKEPYARKFCYCRDIEH